MKIHVRIGRMFAQIFVVLVVIASVVGYASPAMAASSKPSYEYYVEGNSGDVTTSTSAGFVLMGGGTDVDAAFQWMIDKSGGGDFVVIRASGTDAYNPWIYNDLGGVDSAATIIIKNRAAASDAFVVDQIRNAEALFIAGGDQSNYVDYWKGTQHSHRWDERRAGSDGRIRLLGCKRNHYIRYSTSQSVQQKGRARP